MVLSSWFQSRLLPQRTGDIKKTKPWNVYHASPYTYKHTRGTSAFHQLESNVQMHLLRSDPFADSGGLFRSSFEPQDRCGGSVESCLVDRSGGAASNVETTDPRPAPTMCPPSWARCENPGFTLSDATTKPNSLGPWDPCTPLLVTFVRARYGT